MIRYLVLGKRRNLIATWVSVRHQSLLCRFLPRTSDYSQKKKILNSVACLKAFWYLWSNDVIMQMSHWVHPLISAPPRNVILVSVSWNSVTLSWNPPPLVSSKQFADRYGVIVKEGREIRIMTSHKAGVEIDGLKQFTSYWVNIQAGNKAGYGPLLPSYQQFKTKGWLISQDHAATLAIPYHTRSSHHTAHILTAHHISQWRQWALHR